MTVFDTLLVPRQKGIMLYCKRIQAYCPSPVKTLYFNILTQFIKTKTIMILFHTCFKCFLSSPASGSGRGGNISALVGAMTCNRTEIISKKGNKNRKNVSRAEQQSKSEWNTVKGLSNHEVYRGVKIAPGTTQYFCDTIGNY